LCVANSATSIWPEGKTFALCLSHDVDNITSDATFSEAMMRMYRCLRFKNSSSLREAKRVASWIRGFYKESQNFALIDISTWLKWEDEFGFRSTWYTSPVQNTQPHPWDVCFSYDDELFFKGRNMSASKMLRDIADDGWEIGLHPSCRTATDLELLVEQKHDLERMLGLPVYSVRQHYLRYDPLVTPGIHHEAGLLTDSTHGFNRSIGFRAGTAFPYFVWDSIKQSRTNVLELPLNIMDVALFSSGGLECDVQHALRLCSYIMDQVAEVGGCLTLNWHPQCRVDARVNIVYRQLLEMAHQRNAWGASAIQVRNHLVKS
jgi:hypothetical protein